MKKFNQFPEHIKVLLLAVVLVCITIGLVGVILDLAYEKWKHYEILTHKYEYVEDIADQYPTIVPYITSAFEDGKITNHEYGVILGKKKQARIENIRRKIDGPITGDQW